MEDLVLNAKKREKTGKEIVKKIRKQGFVPGILYGGSEVIPISFLERDLNKILGEKSGENTIFQLNIEGAESRDRKVIVREFQNNPVKGELLHADFYEVSMDKEITVTVGITIEGKAFGVEQEGGMINHLLKEVEIECLPTTIPDEIKVDVTNMKIGDVLHLKDIPMPAGVTLLEDLDEPVVSVTAIVEEVVAAPEEAEGAEAAEGEEAGEKAEKEEKKEAEGAGKPEKDEKKDKEKKD
jgi:large subunit ribosomal protein L25